MWRETGFAGLAWGSVSAYLRAWGEVSRMHPTQLQVHGPPPCVGRKLLRQVRCTRNTGLPPRLGRRYARAARPVGRCGDTSARWEKTLACIQPSCSSTDYLRVWGEDTLAPLGRSAEPGIPPRVGRRPVVRIGMLAEKRATSERGEDYGAHAISRHAGGLPPRMRRRPYCSSPWNAAGRTTSACGEDSNRISRDPA